MSANKLERSIKRHHDSRVTVKQLGIWRMYNTTDAWLAQQKPSGFRKRKAMNCGCRTCRGWAADSKRSRLALQLERKGMKEEYDGLIHQDERPDIISDEYEGYSKRDVRPDIITKEWV